MKRPLKASLAIIVLKVVVNILLVCFIQTQFNLKVYVVQNYRGISDLSSSIKLRSKLIIHFNNLYYDSAQAHSGDSNFIIQ